MHNTLTQLKQFRLILKHLRRLSKIQVRIIIQLSGVCAVVMGLSCAGVASAAQAQVIITEVYPAPASGEAEWIEIQNQSSEAVDLSGWYVTDLLSTPTVIFEYPADTMLEAGAFLVAELSSAKLNNSADSVYLYDASGTMIDSFAYTSSTSQKSWCKPTPTATPSLSTPNPHAHCLVPTTAPTPTAAPTPTSTPTLVPTPTTAAPINIESIQLSEVMACPQDGEHEWFEIYNSGSQSVTLSNWYILDAAYHEFKFSTQVPAGGYTVVTIPSAVLNNGGDTITLFSNTHQAVDSFSYSECASGTSFSFVNDDWHPTSPSPGSSNYQPAATSTQSTTSSTTTDEAANTNTATSSAATSTGTVLGTTTRSASTLKPPRLISTVPLDQDDTPQPTAESSTSSSYPADATVLKGPEDLPKLWQNAEQLPQQRLISILSSSAGALLIAAKALASYQQSSPEQQLFN